MNFPNTKITRLLRATTIILQLLGVSIAIGTIFDDAVGMPLIVMAYIGLSLVGYVLFIESIRRLIAFIIYDVPFLKLKFDKYLYYIIGFAGILVAIGLITLPFQMWSDYVDKQSERDIRIEQVKAEYADATERLPELKESVSNCLQEQEEEILKEKRYECNKKKNKVKADYNFCLSFTSINTHASCIYDHDYTTIDCSDESLKSSARSLLEFNYYPSQCAELTDEYERLQTVVDEYKALEN